MEASEIKKLKERNLRVEADKAWETSKTRRGVLAIVTYIGAAVFLIMVNAPNPWVNALIPSFAYLIQTLTFPFLKDYWLKKVYKK